MRYSRSVKWFLLLVLVISAKVYAESPAQCRSLHVKSATYDGPARFNRGLLWRVSKPGTVPSYLFGTIHVADKRIVDLPAPVRHALNGSSTFAMEALPDPTQIVLFSRLMFFPDGKRLKDLLPASLYQRALKILEPYNLPDDAVARMKPWAAYLTMSYPPDFRRVLDLQLLEAAQSRGEEIRGLETLEEEGNILNGLKMSDQVQLLADTVCNYDVLTVDFEKIKALYLKRDLKGLYLFAQRRTFGDDALYRKLMKLLLTERNSTMVKRMAPLLDDGNAFIAIGAMHLPGRKGVLALLARDNYTLSRIY